MEATDNWSDKFSTLQAESELLHHNPGPAGETPDRRCKTSSLSRPVS